MIAFLPAPGRRLDLALFAAECRTGSIATIFDELRIFPVGDEGRVRRQADHAPLLLQLEIDEQCLVPRLSAATM